MDRRETQPSLISDVLAAELGNAVRDARIPPPADMTAPGYSGLEDAKMLVRLAKLMDSMTEIGQRAAVTWLNDMYGDDY